LSSFLGAAVVPFVVVFHAAPILPTLPLAVCSVLHSWNTTIEPSLFVKQECDTRWCGCRRRHLSAGVASSSCQTISSPVVFVNDLHGRPPWTVSPEVTGFSTLPTLPPFHTTLGRWRRVLICRRLPHWHLFLSQSEHVAPHVHWHVVRPQGI
jgi:hypothetical protein